MAKPTKPDARVDTVVNRRKPRRFVQPGPDLYGRARSRSE